MSDSKKDYMMKGQFTAENSVLVLVDYQLGTMQLIRTSNSDVCLRNAVTLATAAKFHERRFKRARDCRFPE
jgi:hypothetical protein